MACYVAGKQQLNYEFVIPLALFFTKNMSLFFFFLTLDKQWFPQLRKSLSASVTVMEERDFSSVFK